MGLKTVDESDCDILTRERVREKNTIVGAIWHIFHPRDADKIRDLLNRGGSGKGTKIGTEHGPDPRSKALLGRKIEKEIV